MPILGGAAAIRAGTVQNWPSDTIPAGWLKCNGAAVSRTLYAGLFTAIGTTYGAGDGSTTFNVPDMRGEFMRGLDDGRGVDSGRAMGSAQAGDVQSHSHTFNGAGGGGTNLRPTVYPDVQLSYTVSTSAVGGTETRPRNRAMHFIIKF